MAFCNTSEALAARWLFDVGQEEGDRPGRQVFQKRPPRPWAAFSEERRSAGGGGSPGTPCRWPLIAIRMGRWRARTGFSSRDCGAAISRSEVLLAGP